MTPSQPLPELSTLRADVPPRLEGLVERCLAIRPESRPTAVEVVGTLREVSRRAEDSLLGVPDVYATEVTGPPTAVTGGPAGAYGLGAPPARSLVGGPVNRMATPHPADARDAHATTPIDHEVFFMNPVQYPTDPMPQVFAPAAAPSVASEMAKQFASFANRTSRPSAADRSLSSGLPFSHVEFAFFTSPVIPEIDPGIPAPTVPVLLVSVSSRRTSPTTAMMVPS